MRKLNVKEITHMLFFVPVLSLFFCISLPAQSVPRVTFFKQGMVDLKKSSGIVERSGKDYSTARLSILQRNYIDILLFLLVGSFLFLSGSYKTTSEVAKSFFHNNNTVIAYNSFVDKELPQKKPEDK
jgi:hypothetical protein